MAQREEQIAPRNVFSLLFTMHGTTSVAFLPVLVPAGRDAWLAAVPAALLASGFLALVVWLAIRFPGRNLVQIALEQLGPWAGRLVALPYLWGFLHLSAIVLRQFGEALATAILPDTPIVLLMGGMILAAALVVRQGIEVIGRLADLITVVFVFSVVITLLLSLPSMHFERLTPLLAEGWKPVSRGAAAALAWFLELFAVGMAAAHLPRPRAALGVTLLAIWTGALVKGFAAAAVVAAFGPEEGVRLLFPVYELARLISIAGFFTRIEPLPMLAWGLGLFLKLSFLFWAGARGVGDWLGLPRYQPLVFPMGVLLLLTAFVLFGNILDVRAFDQPAVLFPYMVVLVMGPALVMAGAALLHRRPGLSGPRAGVA